MQKNENAFQQVVPRLGYYTSLTIVIGAVIGSGIFKKPALMAQQLGSAEWLIAVWVITGIVTLFGALTNAEVAGMISVTGGQYVFFQKMYGKLTAYLYGWGVFAVIQTGSIAAIAYIFAQYLGYFIPMPHLSPAVEHWAISIPLIGNIFPFDDIGTKLTTIGCLVLLTYINYLGVLFGGAVQTIFTTLKVLAIAFLVLLSFISGGGSISHFAQSMPTSTISNIGLLGAIVAAMSGAFWAYDGWNNITYIAGEIREPQKNIPRALFTGTVIIIITYVLVNLAYIFVLPIDEMAKSNLVAADVANRALGSWGGAFVAIAVIISTFGTTNGTLLASARVYYAMAKDKLFFKKLGDIHPRYLTPGPSLWVQCIWASLLVLTGTFDTLTDMLIFVSWIFYALGAYGVFVLRKKMPDTPRPYKVWGYPYVPIIFIAFASVYVVWTLVDDIRNFAAGTTTIINSVAGLALVALGIPLYFWWNRKDAREAVEETAQ
jgi:APA family basic amino acid/polyamine antiporter